MVKCEVMTTPTIAIIGTGNMGKSLITGLLKDGHPPDHLWAADPSSEKLDRLQQQYNLLTTTDNAQAIRSADVVIFAVKPNVLTHVASEAREAIAQRNPLVISIAAGVREASIQASLSGNAAIVRAMPNTPALIGCGASALFANGHVTREQKNMAETMLRAVGIVVWLEKESLLDTVTALSGSGPAYFFLLMESMQAIGEQLGLSPNDAKLLTLQTALGAARMAIESECDPKTLRQQVTSPGGTTEKAISVLETHHIRDIIAEALTAAKNRADEIAEQYASKPPKER